MLGLDDSGILGVVVMGLGMEKGGVEGEGGGGWEDVVVGVEGV